jgi:hypothetical protein
MLETFSLAAEMILLHKGIATSMPFFLIGLSRITHFCEFALCGRGDEEWE